MKVKEFIYCVPAPHSDSATCITFSFNPISSTQKSLWNRAVSSPYPLVFLLISLHERYFLEKGTWREKAALLIWVKSVKQRETWTTIPSWGVSVVPFINLKDCNSLLELDSNRGKNLFFPKTCVVIGIICICRSPIFIFQFTLLKIKTFVFKPFLKMLSLVQG